MKKTILMIAGILLFAAVDSYAQPCSLLPGSNPVAPCNQKWVIENDITGTCCLDFVWESPGPCIITQGINPFQQGVTGQICPGDDAELCPDELSGPGDGCPNQCPWALRLIDPGGAGTLFYPGGPSVYNNVLSCATCNSGWVKATFIVMGSSHVLRFECQ